MFFAKSTICNLLAKFKCGWNMTGHRTVLDVNHNQTGCVFLFSRVIKQPCTGQLLWETMTPSLPSSMEVVHLIYKTRSVHLQSENCYIMNIVISELCKLCRNLISCKKKKTVRPITIVHSCGVAFAYWKTIYLWSNQCYRIWFFFLRKETLLCMRYHGMASAHV